MYETFDEYAADIKARTGRSILHELSDVELNDLVVYIRARVSDAGRITERDRWTRCGGHVALKTPLPFIDPAVGSFLDHWFG